MGGFFVHFSNIEMLVLFRLKETCVKPTHHKEVSERTTERDVYAIFTVYILPSYPCKDN